MKNQRALLLNYSNLTLPEQKNQWLEYAIKMAEIDESHLDFGQSNVDCDRTVGDATNVDKNCTEIPSFIHMSDM